MSDFSKLFNMGGGGIKSIQRGVIYMNNFGGTATITAVNPAKARLSNLGFNGNRSGQIDVQTGYPIGHSGISLVLTNATTITATGVGSVVSWELVEEF